MAATWLNQYGDAVAIARLWRLVQEELDPLERARLGLLLAIAQLDTQPPQFRSIIQAIKPNRKAQPLFDAERSTSRLVERAKQRASTISCKWGLWCEEFDFKSDALRPPSWVMKHNPGLRLRADFRGDLRASVLAALEYDENAGESEVCLAQRSGGSRSQVRNALDNLELTLRVKRERIDGSRRTRIYLVR